MKKSTITLTALSVLLLSGCISLGAFLMISNNKIKILNNQIASLTDEHI